LVVAAREWREKSRVQLGSGGDLVMVVDCLTGEESDERREKIESVERVRL
jgi:hypothetical protein